MCDDHERRRGASTCQSIGVIRTVARQGRRKVSSLSETRLFTLLKSSSGCRNAPLSAVKIKLVPSRHAQLTRAHEHQRCQLERIQGDRLSLVAIDSTQ